MSNSFCRYDLRTTDPDSARSFYEDVLGLDFAEEGSIFAVWPLHEKARAQGAPAHWLGHIGVADLESTVQQLLDRQCSLLGPPLLRGDDGEAFAVLRDSNEAVVAVRENSFPASLGRVVWHQLHTHNLDRSWALYSELFCWSHAETITFEGLQGDHLTFRWNETGKEIGSMANTARLPGVHPHWLYYFSVSDLKNTIAKVIAFGGRTLAPIVRPNGDQFVACEDPQGAAFGMLQFV